MEYPYGGIVPGGFGQFPGHFAEDRYHGKGRKGGISRGLQEQESGGERPPNPADGTREAKRTSLASKLSRPFLGQWPTVSLRV